MKSFLSFAIILSGLCGTVSIEAASTPDNVKKEQTLAMKIEAIKNKTQSCNINKGQTLATKIKSLKNKMKRCSGNVAYTTRKEQKNIKSESFIKSIARKVLNTVCFVQCGYKCSLFYSLENAFGLTGEINGNIFES